MIDVIINVLVAIAICVLFIFIGFLILRSMKKKVAIKLKSLATQVMPEELKRTPQPAENYVDISNRLYADGMVYSQELQTIKEQYLLKYHTPQRVDELTNLHLDLKLGLSDININLALDRTNINPFEIQSVYPLKVTFNPLVSIKIDGKKIENGGEFLLHRIHRDTSLKLEIEYKECKRTYFINTIHSEMPKYKSTGVSKIDGYIYTNVHNYKFILKMDKYGDIIFWRRTNQNSHDFKPSIVNGKLYYSYCDERYFDLDIYGNWSGESTLIIMNDKFEIIDRVGEIKKGIWPEFHDSIILDIGHYIIPSYVLTYVNNIPGKEGDISTSVMANLVHEVKNGVATELFNSINHPEFYAASYIRDTVKTTYNNYPGHYKQKVFATIDYMHLNTLVLRENNTKMLINFRQQNACIYYNIKTKEIEWILGGDLDQFGLAEEQKFWHAHYPTFEFSKHCESKNAGEEDMIVILDNGNNAKLTRVAEYRLDFKNKKLLEFKAYSIATRYSEAGACTQRISEGHYTIGWGLFIGVHTPKYTEVDFNTNTIEFEWFLGHKDGTYRAVKFPY